MDNKFQELIETYQSIHNDTLEISDLIEKTDLLNVEELLQKRGLLIKKADKIIETTQFSDKEKAEINNYVKKIREIENKNLEQMKIKQENIQKELSKLNINQKAITAYKYDKESDPRLIDSKE